jgi:DNA-binding NarL/FixJ family response regulator
VIRIAVTDPAVRVRSALRMRLELEPDMSVVADCASLECAEQALATGQVDVLVIDLVSADAATSPAGRRLVAPTTASGVVVLSMDDRLARVAGPRVQFVSKYAGESAVVDAVRRAHELVPLQRRAAEQPPSTSRPGGGGSLPAT